MVRLIYIDHAGIKHVVEVAPGQSVMEGAVINQIKGILGNCGGACGCATCHIFVDEPWSSRIGEMSVRERSTLRFALGVTSHSRLSCQIRVVQELDGLVVRMPERQF